MIEPLKESGHELSGSVLTQGLSQAGSSCQAVISFEARGPFTARCTLLAELSSLC